MCGLFVVHIMIVKVNKLNVTQLVGRIRLYVLPDRRQSASIRLSLSADRTWKELVLIILIDL